MIPHPIASRRFLAALVCSVLFGSIPLASIGTAADPAAGTVS
jgi:hypothetical protein